MINRSQLLMTLSTSIKSALSKYSEINDNNNLQQIIVGLNEKLESAVTDHFLSLTRLDNTITYSELIDYCLDAVLLDEEIDDGMDPHDIYELTFNVALDVFKRNVQKYSGNDTAVDSEDPIKIGSVQILVNWPFDDGFRTFFLLDDDYLQLGDEKLDDDEGDEHTDLITDEEINLTDYPSEFDSDDEDLE